MLSWLAWLSGRRKSPSCCSIRDVVSRLVAASKKLVVKCLFVSTPQQALGHGSWSFSNPIGLALARIHHRFYSHAPRLLRCAERRSKTVSCLESELQNLILHPSSYFLFSSLSSSFPIPRLSQRGCDWLRLTDAFQISSPSLLWRSLFSPDALPPLPCPLLSPFTGACCKGLAIFPLQNSSCHQVCAIQLVSRGLRH